MKLVFFAFAHRLKVTVNNQHPGGTRGVKRCKEHVRSKRKSVSTPESQSQMDSTLHAVLLALPARLLFFISRMCYIQLFRYMTDAMLSPPLQVPADNLPLRSDFLSFCFHFNSIIPVVTIPFVAI